MRYLLAIIALACTACSAQRTGSRAIASEPSWRAFYPTNTCPAVGAEARTGIYNTNLASFLSYQQTYFRQNERDFCTRNMLLRFLNTRNAPPAECRNIAITDLEENATDHAVRLSQTNTNYRSAEWRSLLITARPYYTFLLEDNEDQQAYITTTTTTLNKSLDPATEAQARRQLQSRVDTLRRELPAASSDFEAADLRREFGKNTLCLEIDPNPLHLPACLRALQIAQDTMTPRAYNIMNLPLWIETLTNGNLDAGIIASAKLLLRRYRESPNTGVNIFNDLVQAFTSVRYNRPQEAAWTILEIIANGGANTIERLEFFYGNELPKKAEALSAIANLVSVLDLKYNYAIGQLYSLSTTVEAACNTSKSYHFWLAAALARRLVLNHRIDPATAAKTAFIGQKVYQVLRPSVLANVIGRPPLDPVHQIIRVDLAMAAIGAWMGATSTDNRRSSQRFNFNAVYSALLERPRLSMVENAQSLSHAQMAYTWNEIFKPNSAFNAAKRQAGFR